MQLKFHLKYLTTIVIMKINNNNDNNKVSKSLKSILMILHKRELSQVLQQIKYTELLH